VAIPRALAILKLSEARQERQGAKNAKQGKNAEGFLCALCSFASLRARCLAPQLSTLNPQPFCRLREISVKFAPQHPHPSCRLRPSQPRTQSSSFRKRAKNAKEQRAPSKARMQRDFFALLAPLRLCALLVVGGILHHERRQNEMPYTPKKRGPLRRGHATATRNNDLRQNARIHFAHRRATIFTVFSSTAAG
jgi:hypothetical protein